MNGRCTRSNLYFFKIAVGGGDWCCAKRFFKKPVRQIPWHEGPVAHTDYNTSRLAREL